MLAVVAHHAAITIPAADASGQDEAGDVAGGESGMARKEGVMIARMWRGWVRTEQVQSYVAYIARTGLREYASTAGNLGCQMWTRDLGDGRSEVVTVSWWESRSAVEGFAGKNIDTAVFYPEDDDYLIDRETTVSHFDVAAAQLP